MPYLFKNIQVDDIMKYITVKQLYEKLNAQHPGIKSRTVTNLINMVLKEYIDNYNNAKKIRTEKLISVLKYLLYL